MHLVLILPLHPIGIASTKPWAIAEATLGIGRNCINWEFRVYLGTSSSKNKQKHTINQG